MLHKAMLSACASLPTPGLGRRAQMNMRITRPTVAMVDATCDMRHFRGLVGFRMSYAVSAPGPVALTVLERFEGP